MKEKYRSMELGKKILTILLCVSFLQIGIILVISYHLSASIITDQTRELINESLEQSADNISAALERYDSIIQGIYTNTEYIDDLKIINSWDGENYYLSKRSLENRLREIIYMNPEILGIAIIGTFGDQCYYDSITFSTQQSYCFSQAMLSNPLVRTAFARKDSVYSPLMSEDSPEYGTHSYFYIAHQLTDFNNYKRGAQGCVVLCIDESRFQNIYSQRGENSNLSFVVDGYGNILSFPEPGYDQTNIYGPDQEDAADVKSVESLKKQANAFIRSQNYFQKGNLITNAISILDGQFFIVNIQDLNYSLERLRYLLIMICLVGALVGAIGFILVYYMSKDTDASVKKILNAMNEANQGNLDSKVEMGGSDEFAKIARQFNVMLSAIKKSNEQERESLVREKNAEIRSLEAQINPHFLYNTLDTINWLAIDEQQFTISQMITRLAQILRYSIHNSNEIVTIGTELEYLKKYIYLQQQRFEYSFQCSMDLDERAQDCRIHKLLLQPLVENTIVHGFSGLSRPGEIHISIQYLDSGDISIEISDNGVGMEPEQTEAFNSFDYRSNKIETSIGVRNVITRIKLYYGEWGRIHFASDSEGTVVTIQIPAE